MCIRDRTWSDEWAAYRNLNANGYVHETVNHTQHFVNPVTVVHTKSIESRWVACKAFLRRRYGVVCHVLPAYLDEYMWRTRHGRPVTFDDDTKHAHGVAAVIKRDTHIVEIAVDTVFNDLELLCFDIVSHSTKLRFFNNLHTNMARPCKNPAH